MGVMDTGNGPDGSCHMLSHGGDSRVSAGDRSDGGCQCHIESRGDSGLVSDMYKGYLCPRERCQMSWMGVRRTR